MELRSGLRTLFGVVSYAAAMNQSQPMRHNLIAISGLKHSVNTLIFLAIRCSHSNVVTASFSPSKKSVSPVRPERNRTPFNYLGLCSNSELELFTLWES